MAAISRVNLRVSRLHSADGFELLSGPRAGTHGGGGEGEVGFPLVISIPSYLEIGE